MSQQVVTLRRPAPSDPRKPAFLSAQILSGRGMMTLQVTAHLPKHGEFDLLTSPPLDEARRILEDDSDGFIGNGSYRIGGAILLPFANRIRGELSSDGRTVRTNIDGRPVNLPANHGGRRPGAEKYSMHGLILASRVDEMSRETTEEKDVLRGSLQAGDFGGSWVSSAALEFENVLTSDAFTLKVTAKNTGDSPLPMGIGWHPYFNLPSGQREQARLHLPARGRALVNDYDEVLPTGEVEPVAGTPYDFSTPGGKPLGDLFLDDCFVDLDRSGGEIAAEIVDPAGSYGLRVTAVSPPVAAIQVYAPRDKGFVVVEPQFNRADPFGPQWGGVDTGMVILQPGESVVYSARLELFTP